MSPAEQQHDAVADFTKIAQAIVAAEAAKEYVDDANEYARHAFVRAGAALRFLLQEASRELHETTFPGEPYFDA